jgi:hypothetical protein
VSQCFVRYKKDYVIVRDQSEPRSPKWDVRQTSFTETSEVVKSTPAGKHEDPHREIEEVQVR